MSVMYFNRNLLTLLEHKIQHYKIFHTLLRKFFYLKVYLNISIWIQLGPVWDLSVSVNCSVKIIWFLITVYHLRYIFCKPDIAHLIWCQGELLPSCSIYLSSVSYSHFHLYLWNPIGGHHFRLCQIGINSTKDVSCY